MEVRTESNTAQMSTIFVWIGFGMLVGVLIIGPLFDKVNGLLLLTVCLLMITIFEALSPTWPNLYAFQFLIAAAGAFIMAIESGEIYMHPLAQDTQLSIEILITVYRLLHF